MGEIVYEISHVVLGLEKMTSRSLFPRNPGDPATVVIGHHLPLATRAREKGGSSADQNYKYSLSEKKTLSLRIHFGNHARLVVNYQSSENERYLEFERSST